MEEAANVIWEPLQSMMQHCNFSSTSPYGKASSDSQHAQGHFHLGMDSLG